MTPHSAPGIPSLTLGLALLVGGAPAHGGDFAVDGALEARSGLVESQKTWLDGGFGRLTDGAGSPSESAGVLRGQLHLGVDFRPSELWLFTAHGTVEGEPGSYGGQRAGLVEGFVQFRPELTPSVALRFRAGLLFPDTSLENVDPLWQSPFTLTLSCLNTWGAEELRLTGVETALQWKVGEAERVDLAGVLFGADEAAGALIAWRGWSMGDRLTTLGETLPLPPLSTFESNGAFSHQEGGTKPMSELDGRIGYELRGRLSRGKAFEARLAHYDNRGDRNLYDGQYSWATTFTTEGLALRPSDRLTLLLEGAEGSTGMGPEVPDRPHVQVSFVVGYALVSWGKDPWRISARIDGFKNRDLDGTAEPDQESGWAWTLAAFWRQGKAFRLGLEYVDLRAERPAALFSGANPDTNGRRAQVEVRTTF